MSYNKTPYKFFNLATACGSDPFLVYMANNFYYQVDKSKSHYLTNSFGHLKLQDLIQRMRLKKW